MVFSGKLILFPYYLIDRQTILEYVLQYPVLQYNIRKHTYHNITYLKNIYLNHLEYILLRFYDDNTQSIVPSYH